jgi:hypothetical protein
MKDSFLLRLLPIVFSLSAPLIAQPWAGVVDPSRAVDWSRAGIPGGVPARATVCATLSAGATAAQINSAIASCGSGQVVKLNAGTYNLTTGITFANHSNVTLRGAGASQTKLVFTGSDGCGGFGASICIVGDTSNPVYGGGTTVNWTAGYAKGTTQITLSSVSGLSVGKLMMLNQTDDDNRTPGTGIFVCEQGPGGGPGTGSPYCADEDPSGGQVPGRAQQQWVKVTAISGNVVTITPGLYMPNWSAGKTPQAYWPSAVVSSSGVEDLSLDHTNNQGQAGTVFLNAYNCWLKGVRSLNSKRSHVWFLMAAASVVRDSYFYGTKNSASESYGIESYLSSDNLYENNIFHHIVSPLMFNGGSSGNVAGYNYAVDDYYTASPSTMMGQVWLHAGGIDNVLLEGNTGPALFSDVIHGTHNFVTAFRNYWIGWESGKTDQTQPVIIKAYGRFTNLVGNVLGRSGTHTQYQDLAPSGTNPNGSIYELGTGTSNVASDTVVASTLLRWGNYDVVSGGSRFVSSEVPSGLAQYANPVPASQTLPASFYLAAKPGWFGSVPYPVIGPDVTGGTGPGGRAYDIPAKRCYDSTTKESSGIVAFDAGTCYLASGPATIPAGLTISNIR